MRKLMTLFLACIGCLASAGLLQASDSDPLYVALLTDSDDERQSAIAALRAEGPAALDRLIAMRADLERVRQSAADDAKRSVAAWSLRRLDVISDHVGGQRYCTVSRLYWHTDFQSALAAAQAAGKPILSLRMLGNLTEEYSCANSRFFRTTLYANEKISKTLREHFVLHWQSVRPVPVVTIDFGDGRKLKRTLTGNSAHYLLAPDGRPLDVLPGLYHPRAFLEWLVGAEQLAKTYAATEPWDRDGLLRRHHAELRTSVHRQWQGDLAKIGVKAGLEAKAEPPEPKARPTAAEAAPLARTKSAIETPILNLISLPAEEPDAAQLEKTTAAQWAEIAALHRYQVDLDDASVALIRRELPHDTADPEQLIAALEDSLGRDTLQNEYRLHARIHEWFAQGEADADVNVLNERVYAELFLTRSSDPWLGLAPSDVYTALDNGGIEN